MLKTSKAIADDNGASRVRPPARYAAMVGDGDAAAVTPPATADAQLPIPWANKSRTGEILSARADVEDKVRGLRIGADDYITKPFHRDELLARVRAIVRRSKGHARSVIEAGDLIVNIDSKIVQVNNTPVPLTVREYQTLELLSLHKGAMLTKEIFLNYLYDGLEGPEANVVDVLICKLRKKLANASS
jgi:DNA-binding response OmpR family regulator